MAEYEDEIWIKITESDKDYSVSSYGRVRNNQTNKILKPRPTHTGYLRVHISTHGGRKDLYIHRLVADAFCIHPEGCNIVNHLDNNPANNKASNLEWTTQQENLQYAIDQKRQTCKSFYKVPVIGTCNGIDYYFESAAAAAKATGCDNSMIIKCCKGKHRYTHNYTWRYAEE